MLGKHQESNPVKWGRWRTREENDICYLFTYIITTTSLGLQSHTVTGAQPGTCLPSLLDPSGPGHTCSTGPYREGDLKVLPAQGALSLEGSGTGLHGSRSDPRESLGQASCQQGACQARRRAGRPDPSPAGHLTGTGCEASSLLGRSVR